MPKHVGGTSQYDKCLCSFLDEMLCGDKLHVAEWLTACMYSDKTCPDTVRLLAAATDSSQWVLRALFPGAKGPAS
jgi:hypothetical protein